MSWYVADVIYQEIKRLSLGLHEQYVCGKNNACLEILLVDIFLVETQDPLMAAAKDKVSPGWSDGRS